MTPTIDFSMIEMLRGLATGVGEPDPLIELRSMFVEDAAAHLRTLGQAVATGDERSARRIAHSLKGMSGSIGAMQLCELSGQFEKAAAIDATRVHQLEQEFVRVSSALLAA